ncbi:hypothetical protein BGZ52_005507, partial [Haplosporangium bisporale]
NIDNIGWSGLSITAPGSWYKEALELMINQRCQSFTLTGFRDFYSHISGTTKSGTTRLKTLTLLCYFHVSQWERLRMILKLCPALRNLTIWATYSDQLCNNIRHELPHLKRLDFYSPTHTIMTKTTKDVNGKLEYTAELNVAGPRYVPPLTWELYSRLEIVRLNWLPDPEEYLRSWLNTALKHCSQLLTLDLRMPLKYFHTLVTILKNEFEIANALHRDLKRIVRLRSMENDHDVTMIAKFKGNDPDFEISIEMTGPKESNAALKTIFQSYGPSIRSLVANQLLDDSFLLSLIETVLGEQSKLARLIIDPAGLSDSFLIQTLVDLLPSPKDFTLLFSFSSLEDEFRRDQALKYLQHYGTQVSGLLLRGADGNPDWISKTIPVRSDLPNLLHLELAFEGDQGHFENEAAIRQVLQFISTPATTTTTSSIMDAALKHLSVEDTNFGASELKLLVGRLPRPTAVPELIQQSRAPLDELVIKNTPLVTETQKLARLETQLLMRAPYIK